MRPSASSTTSKRSSSGCAACSSSRFLYASGSFIRTAPVSSTGVARLAIENGQRGDLAAAGADDGRAGIEAHALRDQRVAAEAVILRGVGHLEDAVAGQGVLAERPAAGHLRELHADPALEALLFTLSETDDGHRRARRRGGDARQVVAVALGQG